MGRIPQALDNNLFLSPVNLENGRGSTRFKNTTISPERSDRSCLPLEALDQPSAPFEARLHTDKPTFHFRLTRPTEDDQEQRQP